MADVFVSYARPDEPHAARVAEALRSEGYEVWRDDELPAHRAYGDVIEERLKAARAVVVLWSAEAARSQWVRAEADLARSAGTLVQGVLDATVPPLPFNQIQCADLRDWDGNGESAGWVKTALPASCPSRPVPEGSIWMIVVSCGSLLHAGDQTHPVRPRSAAEWGREGP